MKPVFQKSQGLWVLIIGLGIGWLAGLSVSAIVSTIITSLLGLGAGVVTGLQTIQHKNEDDLKYRIGQYVDAKPAAILVLGIALAAPCGIMIRTYHVFEPPQQGIIASVSQSDSLDIVTLSELLKLVKENQEKGVLFSHYEEECKQILSYATMKNYSVFVEELRDSNIPGAKEMVLKYQNDPETLEFFLRTICRFYKAR